MARISRPVGRGVINPDRNDVILVQQLLNRNRQPPLRPIGVDGVVGTDTITAIEEFQHRVVKMRVPDGRVDPGGATFRALCGPTPAATSGNLAQGLVLSGVSNPRAQANASSVLQALKDKGITSKRAQANILAQVKAECGFLPRTEGNYSAATLLKLYGPGQTRNDVRFNSLEEAQRVVKEGPEAVFEKIYGGRNGNDSPGDGYKYRGRGYIQLTFKDNYRRVGAAITENLVSNPDLANDPKVATKILLSFLGVNSANQSHFEDINKVNAKVGPAASPASRATFAEAILNFL